jgi:hypothetical protein
MRCLRSALAFQESEDSNSDSSQPEDLKHAGKLNSITTLQPSSQSIGRTPNDTEIFETSVATTSSESTLFAEVSPAKMSPWLVPEPDSKESDQPSGEKCSDSFAKLSPDGLWLRMYQGCSQAMLDGSLETFLGTWHQSGSMRSGGCFRRPEWEPRILGDECLYWRTPSATEADHGGPNARDSKGGLHLSAQVHRWPTPRSSPNENRQTKPSPSQMNGSHGKSLGAEVGGALNPTWVEWLMGFPLEWTALDASETLLYLKSRKRSGK